MSCDLVTDSINFSSQYNKDDQNPPKTNYSEKSKEENKNDNYLYIASLNVRTLLKDRRLLELNHAINEIKWDIIGLCETRRENEKIEEFENFILYHTTGTKGKNGVGFLIKKSLKNSIISFKSYSDRIAAIEIRISDKEIWTIVQVYVPTESYSMDDMEIFYHTLDTVLDSIHTKNLILMGDFSYILTCVIINS